ncbi:MAG: hypothetical protein U0269_10710 [Polyangiales bacterium]
MKPMVVRLGALALVALSTGCFGQYGAGGGVQGGGDINAGGGGGAAAGIPDSCTAAEYGATENAQSFSAFLVATSAFIRAAGEIDTQLVGACRALGTDLGMSDAELTANGADTRSICTAVNAKVRGEYDFIRSAQIRTHVESTPPVCKTRVDEYTQCIQRCQPTVVREGRVETTCTGGELRGSCGASCTGRCAVEVNGSCGGACEGTCSGGCTGVCEGACQGTCASRDAQGNCHGACQGTCYGRCSAGCTGSCQGSCEMSGQASCQGECRGGCSVQYTQPVCTGRVVPPEIRTECRESCDTVQVSSRECTPGQTRIIVDGTAAAEAAERARRLSDAVAARGSTIISLGARVRELGQAGEVMVRNAGGFARSTTQLGAAAAACSLQAVAALPAATARVSVAVNVSVSFQASASGSASAN